MELTQLLSDSWQVIRRSLELNPMTKKNDREGHLNQHSEDLGAKKGKKR